VQLMYARDRAQEIDTEGASKTIIVRKAWSSAACLNVPDGNLGARGIAENST
jgi:hypothetical protein